MIEPQFSKWMRWANRNRLERLELPGVYSLAFASVDLDGMPFNWIPEIGYFGMTNSAGGLRSRLRQFNRTISGGSGHGGAKRVLNKHRVVHDLTERLLFVSISPVACNPDSNEPDDLRIMGEIAKLEYVCIAEYVERFRHLPEFNDKKKSPKPK